LAADPNQRYVVALGLGDRIADALPSITVVIETTGDPAEVLPTMRASRTAAGIETALWNRSTARLALQSANGGELRELSAVNPEQLTKALRGRFILGLTSPAMELSPTLLETLRLLVASEKLHFVRIVRQAGGERGPGPGEMILASRELWHPDDPVDLDRLQAVAKSHPVLGKTVGLAGRLEFELPTLGTLGQESRGVVFRSGRYDVWAGNPRGPVPHPVSPLPAGMAPGPTGDRPTVMVVLAVPLEAGIDDLVAGVLGQLTDDADFVVVSTAADHELALERVARLERSVGSVYELGSILDWRAWPSALERLARNHAASTVLLVGEDPRLDRALNALHASGLRIVVMPVDRNPVHQPAADCWLCVGREQLARLNEIGIDEGRIVPVPVGWPGLADDLGVGAERARDIRTQLGVPAGTRLVMTVTDLVPRARPEAVISVADRLRDEPDLRFLLVGEGPLAGSLLDLVRYCRLDTLIIRSPKHSAAELVAAADVVLDTADQAPFRAAVVAALASAKPVVSSWGRDAESLLAAVESHGTALDPICEPSALEAALRDALCHVGHTADRSDAVAEIGSRVDAGRGAFRAALGVGGPGPATE
jgi:glycosyltransferase involved in cell wall biosynthesis